MTETKIIFLTEILDQRIRKQKELASAKIVKLRIVKDQLEIL